MKTREEEVEKLYKKLRRAKSKVFPRKRELLGSLDAPKEKGVYIILNAANEVLHVGKTSAQGGIYERLKDYVVYDYPAFTRYYLRGKGEKLREGYKFKCIVVNDKEVRAYLKVYTTVKLLRSGDSLP